MTDGNSTEPRLSEHHLFTYQEIRAKIVQIFGEPRTDEEHIRIQEETSKAWKQMPKYLIPHELHKRIHGK